MRGLTSCAKSTASTTVRFSFRAEGAVIDEAIFAHTVCKIELVGGTSIGVSEYRLGDELPAAYASVLPSPEDLVARL